MLATREHDPYRACQFAGRRVLLDVSCRARLNGFQRVLALGIAADHHHPEFGPGSANDLEDVEPASVGHVQVQDQQIESLDIQRIQDRLP